MAFKTFTGTLAILTSKSGTGKRGPWTAYSGKVEKADGTEYEEWISFGFQKPECEKGDEVVITTKKEDGFWKVQEVEITQKASAESSESGDSGTEETQNNGESAPRASSSSSGPNKDSRIQYQHSQDMAIRLVALLLANKAVPLSATAGKAGEAARYEELVALVDKLTVKLDNDVRTGRVLRDVEDVYEAPEAAEAGFDGEEESDDE